MKTLRPTYPLAAVILDFDGVLANSEPLHCRTISETLVAHGYPAIPWPAYRETLMGFDDRDAFSHALRAVAPDAPPPSDALVAQLVAEKAARFAALADAGEVPPLPGAADAVRRLHAAGLPLALSSGALPSDLLPVLRAMGILECFRTLVTAADVSVSKPDPATYLLALRRLGTPPAATLAVEDSPEGIQSAHAAALPVLALTTNLPPPPLLAAGAFDLRPSLPDALPLLLPQA